MALTVTRYSGNQSVSSYTTAQTFTFYTCPANKIAKVVFRTGNSDSFILKADTNKNDPNYVYSKDGGYNNRLIAGSVVLLDLYGPSASVLALCSYTNNDLICASTPNGNSDSSDNLITAYYALAGVSVSGLGTNVHIIPNGITLTSGESVRAILRYYGKCVYDFIVYEEDI